MQPTDVVLRTYTGHPIEVLGEVTMEVEYGNKAQRLPLVVVGGNGPNLLGRDWLQRIKMDWDEIHSVRTDCDKLITKHAKVFEEELGLLHGTVSSSYSTVFLFHNIFIYTESLLG